jgi:hypothetical protein
MKKLLICLPIISAASSLPASAQDSYAPIKPSKCTSAPCGNTKTGEDPQEQRLREASAQSDAIRAGDDDKRRWSSIRLNSDTTKPERLTMPVVKAAGLEMRLDPKLGRLSFRKPGVEQTFAIANPLGDKSSVCPEYSIQIIEASPAHALVRMACLQAEYAPGRYHMGVDYYLYDVDAAVMRNIWRAAVTDKKARLPDAKPTPSLKILANGYRFDWSSMQPSDNRPSTTVLHNSYTRSTEKSGAKVLVCTNLSTPKGEGVEDEMCEGGVLSAIAEKSGK